MVGTGNETDNGSVEPKTTIANVVSTDDQKGVKIHGLICNRKVTQGLNPHKRLILCPKQFCNTWHKKVYGFVAMNSERLLANPAHSLSLNL